MKFILRISPDPGVHHYFVAHGDYWPHRPDLKLIGPTTTNRDSARRFDTHEDALTALKLSDDPPGWEVDEVSA